MSELDEMLEDGQRIAFAMTHHLDGMGTVAAEFPAIDGRTLYVSFRKPPPREIVDAAVALCDTSAAIKAPGPGEPTRIDKLAKLAKEVRRASKREEREP
jgi:hypothetical protein